MSKEERVRRAAEHFSLFALDGSSGALRWRHDGGAHHAGEATAAAAAAQDGQDGGQDFDYPGLGGDLFRDEKPGAAFESLAAAAGAAGRGGGRRYRRSLLRHLPHAWSAPSDTRLEITALRRKGPGDGSHTGGGGGGGGPSGEDARNPPSPGRRRSLSPAAASGSGGGGGRHGEATAGRQGGGVVRAVLARTREGLEAVELATGRPLSAVALPGVRSGAGVFVDLNGDGVVDHVQVSQGPGGRVRCIFVFSCVFYTF